MYLTFECVELYPSIFICLSFSEERVTHDRIEESNGKLCDIYSFFADNCIATGEGYFYYVFNKVLNISEWRTVWHLFVGVYFFPRTLVYKRSPLYHVRTETRVTN